MNAPISRSLTCGLVAALPLLLCACLEPRSSDAPAYSHRVLPEGTPVPSADQNEPLAIQIRSSDGLGGGQIPLHRAWVDDQQVYYWDFGEASATAQPVWLFRRRGAGGEVQAFGHPNLVDSVPGDDNYGPLRIPYLVFVTGRYDGELITSFSALEDAMELGLVEEPVAQESVMPWPFTRSDAALSLPDGRMLAPTEAFYRGQRVSYLPLDTVTTELGELSLSRGRVTPGAAYDVVRDRQDVVLDEESLEEDLNGDGDMVDSNLIFSLGMASKGYSGLVARRTITLLADYEFNSITAASDFYVEGSLGPEPSDEVVAESDMTTTMYLPVAGVLP